jgi:WD40 repeat protein
MSKPTDLLLTDPSERALAAALNRAGPRTLRRKSRWRTLPGEVAGNPVGHSQVEGRASYVSVAWWTDHRGSKHVRVCGDDTPSTGWQPHASSLDGDRCPPLWHVFRDRVYRVRRRGGEPCWLVSCACGVTGSPEEVAWMGDRCGPCHDRREDGVPHPEDGRPVLFSGLGAGAAVTFSADGRRLAVSSTGYYLRIYDVMTGTETTLVKHEADDEARSDANRPLAFSPDGRWLIGGLPREWLVNWWDLDDRPELGPAEMLVQCQDDEEIRGFAFSPDGRLLAAWGDPANFLVVTGDGETLEDERWGISCYCNTLAFSPNSRTHALGHGGWRVRFLDTRSWKVRNGPSVGLHDDEEFQFIAYTPDGRRLVLITGDRMSLGDRPPYRRRLHVCDLVGDEGDRECALPFYVHVAALSPDGRYLAYVVHDEQHPPGEMVFFDLEQWDEAGRLTWNPKDAINDLAFSGDGQTLATVSAAGVVKLWPWGLLLKC